MQGEKSLTFILKMIYCACNNAENKNINLYDSSQCTRICEKEFYSYNQTQSFGVGNDVSLL